MNAKTLVRLGKVKDKGQQVLVLARLDQVVDVDVNMSVFDQLALL